MFGITLVCLFLFPLLFKYYICLGLCNEMTVTYGDEHSFSGSFGPMYHYQYRLILIGDSTVGKSSLLKYFTEGKTAEISDPTVGVDFYTRMVEIRPDLRVKLQLWDTAGQEKFR